MNLIQIHPGQEVKVTLYKDDGTKQEMIGRMTWHSFSDSPQQRVDISLSEPAKFDNTHLDSPVQF